MEAIFKFLVAVAITAAQVVIGGLTFLVLWHWFMIPLGAVRLSLAAAMGLSLVVEYFLYPILLRVSKVNPYSSVLEDLSDSLVHTLKQSGIYLLFGFIIHLFM